MKDEWLFLGCCLCILAILPIYASIFMLIGIAFYHSRRFSCGIYLFIFICIVFFLRVQHGQINYVHNTSKEVKIIEINEKYTIGFNGQQKVLIYGLDDISYDDVVRLKGVYKKIDSVCNEGQFDFTKWANRKGIYESINIKNYEILKKGSTLRHYLYSYVQNLPKKQSQIIKGLLYGNYNSDEFPLISASGMHITFILNFFMKIWEKYFGYQKGLIINFVILCGIAYTTIVSVSIFRLLCFQFVKIITKDKSFDQIGKSMILILFYNPNYIYELGFLIPITFRIIYLFNVQKRNKWMMSLIILFPIQIYFFHSCDIIQIILFPILRIFYAILYLLAWILLLPNTSLFCTISYELLNAIKRIDNINFLIYGSVNMGWVILWMYHSICFISYKNYWNTIKLVALFILFFLIPYTNPFVTITMLDVGQGDCTLIQMPYQKEVYMIDIMGNKKKNIPKDIVVPYLHSQGIRKIDQLLITHHDFDHSGGLKELQELFQVDIVIDTKDKAKEHEKAYMKYLLLDYKGNDENDNSIVTILKAYDKIALFMGDLGIKGERELLRQYPKLEVDILKAGHHGSKTSSSSSFLHQIQPTISLISCGRNNFYKHPNQEVLNLMKKEKIYPIISKNQGSCVIKIGKYFSYFKTAKGQYGLL